MAPVPRYTLAALTCIALAVACDGNPIEPGGSLRVSVVTTGGDRDRDGYGLVVDALSAEAIGDSGLVTLDRMSRGPHALELRGVADNCTVAGDNPRAVSVASGSSVDVSFTVDCVVTGVHITVEPIGIDLDADGYGVVLDNAPPIAIPTRGEASITYLSAGSHTMTVSGVAPNCALDPPNPQTLNLTTGQVIEDALTVSCKAATADLLVATQTTGLDIDPDGYTVSLDGGAPLSIGANGARSLAGLAPGSHTVTIGGSLSANCTLAGSAQRTFNSIIGGLTRDTAYVTFDVTCLSVYGVIQVTTTTSGGDPDSNGFVVRVDNGPPAQVPNNGVTLLSGVATGSHSVHLLDVDGNCAPLETNPTPAQIAPRSVVRDTARVTFTTSCAVVTGSVQVTATTTGSDVDIDGYTVGLYSNPNYLSVAVMSNGSVTAAHVMPGLYQATLDGLASNCDTTGPGTQSGNVVIGGITTFAFAVACRAAAQLAVSAGGGKGITLVKENGTGRLDLTTNAAFDAEPAWSPDGSKIAFVTSRDGNREIYVMNADGSGQQRLTSHPAVDEHPDWSPDGTRIAFTSTRDGNAEIYVMNADGSNATRLTNNSAVDADPSWSPDGLRIAFSSTSATGQGRIYIMQADGTGLVPVTPGVMDETQPDWSPDGTRIAFARNQGCYYYCVLQIVVIGVNGSNEATLANGIEPAWSPDGLWIAYSAATCDYYYSSCVITDAALVTADGLRNQVVIPAAVQPAWRP